MFRRFQPTLQFCKRFQSSKQPASSNASPSSGAQQKQDSNKDSSMPVTTSGKQQHRSSLMSPFSMFQPLFDRDFNRMFNHMFQVSPFAQMMNMRPTSFPSVDVKETNDAIQVIAEVPGVNKENIKLHYDEQMHALTIEGETSTSSEKHDAKYHSVERHYGSFYRTIPIPETVKQDQIKAEYKDGCLTVTLPKSGEQQKSQIKID